MKLFPYIFVRVGGGPFDRLKQLQLRRSSQVAQDIYRITAEIDALKNQLSEAIYPIVGEQTESDIRRALINLRRDIFNEREVTPDRVTTIRDSLPEAVYEEIGRYIALTVEKERLRQEGAVVYDHELTAAKHHMDTLTRSDNLLKGLILSSQSLLKYGIPNYLDRPPDELDKQGKKTEQSLIKYLSRIYAKTSPFSTFTNLAVARADLTNNGAGDHLRPAGPRQPEVVSHIRLNNFLYRYLKDLLLKNREVYLRIPLRPNPTLTQEKDCYLFLTNNNNVESFQRMPLNPILSLFQNLTSAEREGVVFQDVMQTLTDRGYIDAPFEAIESYMNQLLGYGFLEFNIGVSGIDPDWDLKLRERLAALCPDIPLIGELLDVLAGIRQMAGRYEGANVAGRQQLLELAYDQFKAICMKLHEAAGLPEEERQPPEMRKGAEAKRPSEENTAGEGTPEENADAAEEEIFTHQTSTYFYFKPEQMFYEDTALGGELYLNQSDVTEVISVLDNLLRELTIFEGHQDEWDKMRLHFERTYNPDEAVNLLTFYEEYYREFKKPEAERMVRMGEDGRSGQAASDDGDDEEGDRFFVPSIAERQKQVGAWLDEFSTLLKKQELDEDEEIHLSLEQVVRTNAARNEATGNCWRSSFGTFAQLYEAQDQNGRPRLMAVINSSFPGYGKMTSRFLHLFPEAVTATTCCWNEALSHQDLLIENADASFFNANLHPPLLPYEMQIPGSHNSLPAERQIAATELKVALDVEKNQLYLLHEPSQRRSYIFDLGFQGGRGRSQLFNLLSQFTLASYLSHWPLTNAVNRAHGVNADENDVPSSQIQIKPRVVYEGRLVLQRKTWLVPQSLLPLRQPEEDDWDYFAHLNGWRLAQGIPDEVFVYLFERNQMENMDAEARAKMRRDDYKPQYISFQNPFLVGLLEKLLLRVPKTLKIVEMLPNSEQLLTISPEQTGDKAADRYVTEFIIQWYEGGMS